MFLTLTNDIFNDSNKGLYFQSPSPLAPQMLSAGLHSKDKPALSLFNYDDPKLKLNFCLECGIQ